MFPKVSVAMPVYNGERFLREAVDSILNQTFSDFELIVVDDASSDTTGQILTDYAGKDSRVVLERFERNAGVVAARNRGLALARGEYVAVLDADDISYPERLALQVNYLEAHPHLGAVGAAAKRIDEYGNLLSNWQVPTEHDTIKALLLFTSPICHSTLTARRHLVQQIGGYQAGLDSIEDYDLWWRLSCVTRLAALTEPLVSYRSSGHPQRLTDEKRREQLRGSQAISLGIARTIMGVNALDEEAYKRFFLSSRGVRDGLQAGDIHRLQPLWDTLAADPVYCQVLTPRLLSFSLKLSRSQPGEALQLLMIVKHQFNAGAYDIGRKFFQTYAPPPVQRLGRYLRRAASNALHGVTR